MGTTKTGRWVWLVVGMIAVAISYMAGLYQGQVSTIEALQKEAAGNLTQRIEALSLLRIEETAMAITRLEDEADRLALSIAANDKGDRRALESAKAYRTAVPAPASRKAELDAVFASVPDLEPSQCSSALRTLLLRTKSSGTGLK